MGSQGKGCGRRGGGQRQGAARAAWSQRQPFPCSHDFIGEFTTSYRELARGQSQFNIYEVRWAPWGLGSALIIHDSQTLRTPGGHVWGWGICTLSPEVGVIVPFYS